MAKKFDYMYGWFFTYNSFTGMWRGSQETHIRDLMTSLNSENVITSKNMKTLEGVLAKHEGLSAKEINKIYG